MRKISIKHKQLNDDCDGFGFAYSEQDDECANCDEFKMCKKLTNDKLKGDTKEMATIKKLLAEAKKLKNKAGFKKFFEDNELEVKVLKSDTIAKLLKKTEAALKEAEEADDADEGSDGDDEDELSDLLEEIDNLETFEEFTDFIEENELDVKIKKSMKFAKMRGLLKGAVNDLFEDAGNADSADEPDDDDDDDGDETESDDDGDDEGDDDDIAELVERVGALETRLAALQGVIDNLPAAGKRGMGKEEKEEIRAKLLKKVPYTKAQLTDMNGKVLKQLGSALKINTFGKKTAECIKMILTAQKKKKK